VADIIREATFEDTYYNSSKGLRLGMILFIVSEVMFFSLFLGIFHSSVAPVHNLGGVWPLSY
jgi:heme/copper-type cytochrome/quinol oxidase subunit 3